MKTFTNNRVARRAAVAMTTLMILGISGCLEFPLGDPETSKVDSRFTGYWMSKVDEGEASELMAIIPYDSRTYLVTQMRYRQIDEKEYQREDRSDWKVWLTNVGGQMFMTAFAKGPGELQGIAKAPYYVAKVELNGDALCLSEVDGEFVKAANVTTSPALMDLIAHNLTNPKLYTDKPRVMDKVGQDRWAEMKAIGDACH